MTRTHPLGYPKRNRLIDNNVDTSPVAGATANCVISSIRVSNPTGGALTFSLEDNASTPNDWYEAVSIAANSASLEILPGNQELYCQGGFDYLASGAGLDIQIIYWTNPDVA